MPTTTEEQLDKMISHIVYEVHQIAAYLSLNNSWCWSLRDELRALTQRSILEAGLLHLRCVIEFLGDKPNKKTVVARDYLGNEWTWKMGAQLGRELKNLQGRLAHLGFIRAADPAFDWTEWLATNVPIVLRGYRDFLVALREQSPERFERFVMPRRDSWTIDLELLEELVGEAAPAERG